MNTTNQVAVQLWSVRDHLGTEEEISGSLSKLYDIGYRKVEAVAFIGDKSADWALQIRRAGLSCCSLHSSYEIIAEKPHGFFKMLERLSCNYIVTSIPRKVDFHNFSQVEELVRGLNKTGKLYKDAGYSLVYHNHNVEFAAAPSGKPCLDYILEETDPEYVSFQPDIFWIQYGGGNPENWICKLKGRMPSVHLIDYGNVRKEGSAVYLPQNTPLGTGVFELGRILSAAMEAGCVYLIVEDENNWIDGDPFKSLEKDFKYLQNIS